MSRLSSLLRRVSLLDRGLSFARDRLPYRLMPRRTAIDDALASLGRHCTFVQIGANDGVTGDPIHRHVRWGRWTGVVVEPSPVPYQRLAYNYRRVRRVTPVNAAVAAVAGAADFFHVPLRPGDPWYADQIGSFVEGHVRKHTDIPDIAHRVVRSTVPVETFEGVCAIAGLSRVDLVHLDVEGYDAELLLLLPYEQAQIRAVLFEHLHMTPADRAKVQAHLSALGFTPAAEDAMDALWQRR